MVKLTKLYTRQGDTGKTSLLGGTKVSKFNLQVEAYGDIDELNSVIGIAQSQCVDNATQEISPVLLRIQQELFDIGAELATPQESDWKPPHPISLMEIQRLEDEIDRWTKETGSLSSFILPGGGKLASTLHLGRAVCRRAERRVCQFASHQELRGEILQYLNRLSDWLFALARYSTKITNSPEVLWDASRKD